MSNGARLECPRPLAKGHGGVESATRRAATAGNRLSGQSSRRSFFKAIGGLLIPLQPPAPDIGAVTFVDIAAAAGLAHAKNVSGAPESKQTLLEEMGCGVALFDYDNDGGSISSWLTPAPARAPASATSFEHRDARLPMLQKARFSLGWVSLRAADYDNDGLRPVRHLLGFETCFITTPATERSQTCGRPRPDRRGASARMLDYDRDGDESVRSELCNFDLARAPRLANGYLPL